jgi:uncharacterized protein YbaR (Trm112 family)
MAPDPLGTLDAVLAGLHTLVEISEDIAEETLRTRISGTVTGLRAAVLTVRDQILQQQEQYGDEAAKLRQKLEAATPRRERALRTKFGCYQFDESEGLFCAACYDRQARKIRTIPRAGNTLVCPNCRAAYPMR